nr:GH116 family glycosyl hydrolase [uncultured Blautia sp.]
MADELISIIPDMKRKTIDEFVKKAQELDHPLLTKKVNPQALVRAGRDESGNGVIVSREDIAGMKEIRMKKGDSLCMDFGDHYVGHVTLKLASAGSPQDAPAYLRLKFAEIPNELLDDSSTYEGWISKGWIQEEYIHIDVLPCELKLPRRYAFRYLEVLAIDTSQKFQVVVEDASLTAESAVELESVAPVEGIPEDMQKIDRVALKTLQDCMQHVFEDGPKRDRRLWIGDLRLQAKANYATFRNFDLVKRCMYLFAGLTREDGKIGACLFTEPVMQVDDTFLWDYSLFFVSILYDYYNETKDEEVLKELWPAAYRQIQLALDDMEDGVLKTDNPMIAFIDWKEGLDRQAAAQGVWIYCLRQGAKLAELAGDETAREHIDGLLQEALKNAVEHFWDEEQGFFVSGSNRQISWSSQAWMVLADVFDAEKSKALMNHLLEVKPEMGVSTPYGYHHIIEALLHVGEKDEALELLRTYWGGMIDLGADTFWEAFDPADPNASPYGNTQVNSFCHAWSCTPAWLFREYFQK